MSTPPEEEPGTSIALDAFKEAITSESAKELFSNNSSTDEPASTSKDMEMDVNDEKEIEKRMDQMVTIEEYIQKSKHIMLDYEKHMFLDLIDTDGLVVCAKFVSQTIVSQ